MSDALSDWSKLTEKLDGKSEGCMQVLYERDKADLEHVASDSWDYDRGMG